MKISDIFDAVKGPLASVAVSMIPFGPQLLGVVNALLPDDKKLPETATGSQIADAVESLPPEQRASLMEKRIDLQIAREEGWTDRYKAMTAADGQSTRPRIALMMAWSVVAVIGLFTAAIAYQTAQNGLSGLSDAAEAWPLIAALLGIPSGLLGKYFGEIRREQAQRLGVDKSGLVAGLSKILKS